MQYFYFLLFLSLIFASKLHAQQSQNIKVHYESIILLNFDNTEYKISDMKGKHILYTCINLYAKKPDSLVKAIINYYEGLANDKSTNKDYNFIVVLYDYATNQHIDEKYVGHDLYTKIGKDLKLKSNRVFFIYEEGASRQFSDNKFCNISFVPVHSGFSIDQKGEICYYTNRKNGDCVTPELMKIFKNFDEITRKI